MLWTLAQRKPSEVDQHIAQIMETLQSKLVPEHVAHYTATIAQSTMLAASQPGEAEFANIMQPYDLEIQTGLILKAIDIVSMRMDVLGDHRTSFLGILASLLENSISNPLCLKISDIVESCIIRSEGSWSTSEEKTALQKILTLGSCTGQTLSMESPELVYEGTNTTVRRLDFPLAQMLRTLTCVTDSRPCLTEVNRRPPAPASPM
jgi:transformation/transcription domain-associated protein